MKTKIIGASLLYLTIFSAALPGFNLSATENIRTENSTDAPSISPNTRILPGTNNQVQTSVSTHPSNPNIMVSSAITDVYPGGYTTGAYITTNGGVNWSGTNSIRDHLGNIITTLGDPNVVIDKNGNYIITYTAPPLSGSDYKAGVSYSTNGGAHWSPTVYVPGVDKADKVTSIADNSAQSPYYGRVYLIYSDYIKNGLYISYSTNSGVTWDSVKRLSPAFADARVGASVILGKQGEIFVSWPFYNAGNSSSYIGFAKSTNGGINWIANDTAIFVNLDRLAFRLFLNSCRLNGLPTVNIDRSGGPGNGNLYITCTEKTGTGSPATDAYDVLIHTSTNSGASWNAARRVNQDVTGSLKYQFFPVTTIDDHGGVNVIYYDTRSTVTNDSFEVYLARSLDGGINFQDYLISDHKFKIKAISPTLFGVPGYVGSYIGVTYSKKTITPVWFDNGTGVYQAWTSSINIGLEVRLIPQGFYNLTTDKLRMKDTVKAYLRNSSAPYSIVDSSCGVIDSVSFKSGFVFTKAASGNYYLEIRHRNSLTTWSKNALNYSTAVNPMYDFTASANMAMGDNMIQLNGKHCIYSGDINRDGRVDMIDIGNIYNDMSSFAEGYSLSDVNGDRLVDLNDLNVTFNNSVNFIASVVP